jgi:TRAP-type C4-dicarboxylate transport system permease small subunit
MTILRRLLALLIGIETALLVLSLSIMVLLAFGQVILRNLFDTGFLWGDPLVRQMVVWTGFLGAALAAKDGRHITIDAFTKYLPERLRAVVAVVTSVAAAVISWFLADAAWVFLADEKAAGGELFLGIPSWVGLLIIPAGYWLIAFHFIVGAIERAVGIARGATARPTAGGAPTGAEGRG